MKKMEANGTMTSGNNEKSTASASIEGNDGHNSFHPCEVLPGRQNATIGPENNKSDSGKNEQGETTT